MDYMAMLSDGEKEQLYKLPAYISLLAAHHDGGIDATEKKAAIKLSHIKSYKCNPLLAGFYDKADKVFAENITSLDEELPKDRIAREHAIRRELMKLNEIINRLGPEYATAMRQSMHTFTSHVARAHNSVFEYVLFPMPIKGITE